MAAPAPSTEATIAPSPAPALPAVDRLSELHLPVDRLPHVHEALARALGEAGVGGAELIDLFASGVRGVCVGCGLSVTGAELGEITVACGPARDQPLSPKLERLRLGRCPRNGCDARFFNVEVTKPGRFDRGLILGRTKQLLEDRTSLPDLKPPGAPATRRAIRRLFLIALGTLLVSFVAYRLIFFSSQPIPFVEPQSPYAINPASLDPDQK